MDRELLPAHRPTAPVIARDPAAEAPAGPRLLDVQRTAGNRAAARVAALRSAVVVQREAVDDAAEQLRDAIEGLGTDEDTIFSVLGANEGSQPLRAAYQRLTGRSLEADLRDDLSGSELDRALRMYFGHPGGIWDSAVRLKNAMEGAGTDEEAVYGVLEGQSTPADLERIKGAYQDLTQRSLEADIRDDFSGDELDRALQLLGMGTFTNRIPQDMFEGGTTVVQGRFDYRFEDGKLKVDAKAKFVPVGGVDVPLATWQSQIDNVWNEYALVEPGGQKIPIEMSLVNDSGSSRTIRVVQNEEPGTYGGEDRANAGKWYPVMPASTAPHEFGHLIGLEDEYQRSKEDFEDITGAAPTGPENTSGKSEEDIADELNTALTGDDVDKRAADATTVLTSAGLMVGGRPQQGDFAQAVMAAYDAKYSPSLQDALIGLPRRGRWMLQSVFSYASGTIMGNPGVVPHEHPVAPRHLREFVNIAKTRFPTFEWTTGPR